MSLERSRWWQTALAPGPGDPFDRERAVLRSGLDGFRGRALSLASRISHDLPDFTIHDGTHIDALWGIAETVAGEHIELTPTEAFVFGGAALLHDLGLAVAAYPDPESLHADPAWSDALAVEFRRASGRWPTRDELADVSSDVRTGATRTILRHRHAEQAEKLVGLEWVDSAGTRLSLLENVELQHSFGWLMGRLARSHWWDVADVVQTFLPQIPAPGDMPAEWTLRPLLLACLLRVADAGHLDIRRAPLFEHALRSLDAIGEAHWSAQERLTRPMLEGDRLRYVALRPFDLSEADTWWIAADLLRSVDKELKAVDSALNDLKDVRLAARGVADVDSVDRVSRVLPTDGWRPVEAAIHISDVSSLVRQLGGSELYGDRPWVPLRELLQNAADATRLRRTLESRPDDWGCVTVTLEESAHGVTIEVADQGVGMSEELLVGTLLDYGSSLWRSPLLTNAHPGAASSGFNPTGRFGIGFFSVFMWGNRVTVTSRRPSDAQAETTVLEFSHGIEGRPIVRKAAAGEQLLEGGTAVRVTVAKPEAILGRPTARLQNLARLIGWLCPALDVSVRVRGAGEETRVIAANDWRDVKGVALLGRLIGTPGQSRSERTIANAARFDVNLRPLLDSNGRVIGRLALAPGRVGTAESDVGVIHEGGLRVEGSIAVAGVLEGTVTNAARTEATATSASGQLADWATEQAEALSLSPGLDRVGFEAASMVLACGGDPEDLPICRNSRGLLTEQALHEWASDRDVVLIAKAEEIGGLDLIFGLRENVLVSQDYPRSAAEVHRFFGLGSDAGMTVGDLIYKTVMTAWNGDGAPDPDVSQRRIGTLFDANPEGDFEHKPAVVRDYIRLVRQR